MHTWEGGINPFLNFTLSEHALTSEGAREAKRQESWADLEL